MRTEGLDGVRNEGFGLNLVDVNSNQSEVLFYYRSERQIYSWCCHFFSWRKSM